METGIRVYSDIYYDSPAEHFERAFKKELAVRGLTSTQARSGRSIMKKIREVETVVDYDSGKVDAVSLNNIPISAFEAARRWRGWMLKLQKKRVGWKEEAYCPEYRYSTNPVSAIWMDFLKKNMVC